jgi:hypothetical protein
MLFKKNASPSSRGGIMRGPISRSVECSVGGYLVLVPKDLVPTHGPFRPKY